MDGLTLAFPQDTGSNESVTFSRNASGQITQRSATNDTYSWDQPGNVGDTPKDGRPYVANALNQYTSIGSTAPYSYRYDTHGNLTTEHFPGASGYAAQDLSTFVYTSDNLLHSSLVAPDPRSGDTLTFKDAFTYDNLNRLQSTTGGGVNDTTPQTSQYGYDGSEVVGEYTDTGALKTRTVRGPWADEPLVAVDNSGSLSWYHADERGSLLAKSDASGHRTAVNTYDEFGIPSNTSFGLFGYTGQMYLRYLGMSFYKARVYSPTMGRFLQPDPIGYGDGLNWYNYAHGDPVNGSDPSGLSGACYIPTGTHICTPTESSDGSGGGGGSGNSGGTPGGGGGGSGGNGYDGGPYNGAPVGSLPTVGPGDPGALGAQASFGGFYDGNNWIPNNSTGWSAFGSGIGGANGFRYASGSAGGRFPPVPCKATGLTYCTNIPSPAVIAQQLTKHFYAPGANKSEFYSWVLDEPDLLGAIGATLLTPPSESRPGVLVYTRDLGFPVGQDRGGGVTTYFTVITHRFGGADWADVKSFYPGR